MGCVITYRATSNGVGPAAIEADTLDEASLQIPDGAYTVLPVFGGRRVVRLDRHWARMDDTVRLLGIDHRFDHGRLRRLMRECVEQAGLDSARVRLTLPQSEPGAAYISVEAWQPLGEEFYARGVRVVTVNMLRDKPRAKSTHFIRPRSELFKSLPEGIYEAILCGPGGALVEGATSNFYALLDGVLHTAQEGMLIGVARSIVLDACAETPPIALVYEPIKKSALAEVSEAMLSSASRGVVPIVEIDGAPVGGGTPGPVCAELRRRYHAVFERELEPL
jgi:branched-subunit amino acid aminotransferase/4-amino-4-deoxychorismate lyase